MFIISAVGPDKPGMAHAVAQIIFESGCNIEDTTMTRLSGQFAMILVVEAPIEVSTSELETRLHALQESHGLHVDISPVDVTKTKTIEAPRWILTAYGPEKTGLLARLTGVLSKKSVNVTDVQTRVASKGLIYVMLVELELPADLDTEILQDDLRAELGDLQISLRPIDEDTL